MTARGKKLKRKRTPSISFGELMRKLLQPEPEASETALSTTKQRKSAAKPKRKRKDRVLLTLVNFTSRILEGLVVWRGLVEPRKVVGCGTCDEVAGWLPTSRAQIKRGRHQRYVRGTSSERFLQLGNALAQYMAFLDLIVRRGGRTSQRVLRSFPVFPRQQQSVHQPWQSVHRPFQSG